MYKYFRIITGVICLLAGIGFFFIPFLPIGYILLFIGAVLLAPEIPLFRQFFQWLETKDKSGRLKKVLRKLYQFTDNKDVAAGDRPANREENIQ